MIKLIILALIIGLAVIVYFGYAALAKLVVVRGVNFPALKTILYTAGAGAIGFFMRWIQHQMSFDKNGLVNPSVWNVILPFYIIIAFYLAHEYIKNFYADGYSIPDEFERTFDYMNWKYHFPAVIVLGLAVVLMLGGSVLLFAMCEADKNATLLRIVSAFGLASAACFVLLYVLASRAKKALPYEPIQNKWAELSTKEQKARLEAMSNQERADFVDMLKLKRRPNLSCVVAIIPMLMYCVWLLATYKMNDINPVVWSYAIEIITVCVSIMAFFRVAGYPFSAPKGKTTLLYCMASCFMCCMTIADSRYIGMQLMIAATAIVMCIYIWVLVANADYEEPVYEFDDNGGFEDLDYIKKKKHKH